MKRFLTDSSLVLAVMAMVACSDTYDGSIPQDPDVPIIDPDDKGDGEQEMEGLVRVTYANPCYDVLNQAASTRGAGAFQNPWNLESSDNLDAWGGWTEEVNGQPIYVNPHMGRKVWNESEFYIYAFNKNTDISIYDYSRLLNDPTAAAKLPVLLDGSYDEIPNYSLHPHGKIVALNKSNEGSSFFAFYKANQPADPANGGYATTDGQSGVNLAQMENTDLSVFKYDKGAPDERFRFYGYFISDARITDGSFLRGKGTDGQPKQEVSFEMTINGTQDIMCGRSFDKMVEVQDKIKKNVAAAEQQEVQDYLFSSHSGNRNIHPLIKFKHQLCYIQFMAVNAATMEQQTMGEADLVVTGVDLQAPETGRFFVVRNVDGDSEMPNYVLADDGLPVDNLEEKIFNPADPTMTWEPYVEWTPRPNFETVNRFTWQQYSYPHVEFFNYHLATMQPITTTVQVQQKDDQGNPMVDAEGNPVMKDEQVPFGDFADPVIIGGKSDQPFDRQLTGIDSPSARFEAGNYFEVAYDPTEMDPNDPNFKDKVYERKATRLGNMGLMVPPMEFFPMLVTLAQTEPVKDAEGNVISKKAKHAYVAPYDLRLSGGKKFEAGKVYTVRLAIYPDAKIEAYVSVTNWKPGGSAEVEPGTGFEEDFQ